MLRICICLIGLLSATAWADLTVDGTSSPGLNGGVERFRMYLMDEQLRVDQVTTKTIDGEVVDDVPNSILIRFTGEPAGMLLLDHSARKVKVVATMDRIPAEQAVDARAAVSVIKRDETREILGRKAQRYDFSFNGSIDPMALTGQQLPPNMSGLLKVNLAVTGSSWVVPGMEGAQELAAFMEKMAENRMTIGLDNASLQNTGGESALISPELTSGLKEVMTQISTHGLPLQTTTNSNVSVAMDGQMGLMMQGMLDGMGIGGSSHSETIATRVDASAVDATLFYDGGVPDGYTVSDMVSE